MKTEQTIQQFPYIICISKYYIQITIKYNLFFSLTFSFEFHMKSARLENHITQKNMTDEWKWCNGE